MITLRPEDQEISVAATRRHIAEGIKRILIQAPCGFGKCLGKGTPVLMFDGSVKPVEEIAVGDLLMGPDSKPRRVESLARGREPLYRVTPKVGDAYVVNESHVLSLKMGKAKWRFVRPDGGTASSGDIVNIEVRDYLRGTDTFKAYAKGWRAAVSFQPREAPAIPAYVMGAWLGDGTSRSPSITTADTVIANEFIAFGKKLGLKPRVEQNSEWSVVVHMSTGKKGGNVRCNPFLDLLRQSGVWMNKHIPDDYLLGSETVRLELLAGILDTDGYLARNVFTIAQKSEVIAKQIAFLARSLGFAVSVSSIKKTCCNNGVVGNYYSVVISGDTDRIPCRLKRKQATARRANKDPLLTGITVEPIGEGDYFGFELSGPDRLFLLGDFTVTHNTVVGAYIAKSASEKKRRVLFLVHREELAKQASRTFTAFGVEHGMIMAGRTFDPTQSVYVGMIDTVRNRIQKDKLRLRPAVVLVDECHHAVSKGWKFVIDHFHSLGAVVIGLSATPQRLSGEPLSDVFDVMVPGPTVRELIDRGSLCDYAYYAPPQIVDLDEVHTKYGDFATSELAAATDKPTITGDAISHYKRLLPGKRAIIFAVNITHSKHVVEQFCADGIPAAHVDGEMDRSERSRIVKAFEDGEILVMSNVSLFGEGFDVKACDGVIMLRATQSLALHVQMVGRAMRPHETKEKAVIIDHVGNVGRHGLPDADHDWSLEGKKKKRGKKKDTEEIKVKQCPTCYRVHVPASECPYCGHVYEASRSGPEQVDGELREITREMLEAQRKEARITQGKAQTVDELMAATGMSRFRAQAIVKARADKAELHDSLAADLRTWAAETGEFPGPTFGATFGDIRKMKPKELKELRARFDAHRAAKRGDGVPFFELESA